MQRHGHAHTKLHEVTRTHARSHTCRHALTLACISTHERTTARISTHKVGAKYADPRARTHGHNTPARARAHGQCASGRYAEWHAACVEADMAERRNEWRLVEANAYATQPVRARLVVRLLAWFACMCVSDQCELLARERGGFEFAWVRVWTLRALAHDRCTCDCCAQVLRGRHRSQYNTFAACRKGPYRCLPLFRTLINAH